MKKPQVRPAPDRYRTGPDRYLSADLSAVLPLESGQLADSTTFRNPQSRKALRHD